MKPICLLMEMRPSNRAREAFGYSVLSAVIKVGCRAAIRISEKI